MTQSFETPSPTSSLSFSRFSFLDCSLIARSQYAETVVQAAYASRGRRPLTKSFAGSDGLVETLVTLLATILFGLGWASIEMRSADAALKNRPAARAALALAYADTENKTGASTTAAIGVSAETGYAAVTAATSPLPFHGALNTQWTDEPHARSKR